MFTFKSELDDGFEYFVIQDDRGKKIGEVYDSAICTRIVTMLNDDRKHDLSVLVATLSPVEPNNKAGYDKDLQNLVHAAKTSTEVRMGKEARLHLMRFLTARLCAYVHEIHHDEQTALRGIGILAGIAMNLRPGFVNGLSRTHKPTNDLWSLDAQAHWSELMKDVGNVQQARE